ncbi:MAG TPA: PrsW family glutamic-type intramembrane protease, partial [Spirochaetia bacterium]|nr:PrsW family glutamic-type intramembrane protease [Spirochaetia bacterium]
MQENMSDLPVRKKRHAWWQVLLAGLALYLAGLLILVLTGNPNLFPTVVLIGNFLFPVTFVAFFYQRRHHSRITVPLAALSFFYGGILGTFAAGIIESLIIHRFDFRNAILIGLIEEFAKIIGVILIARRQREHLASDGLVLGAAAGMGFAAFESTGYTFVAFLASGGSLSATVGVTMLRGLLSPLGHGTWTAILAGVLFHENPRRGVHFDGAVIGAYLGVSALHSLWDGLPPFIAYVASSGVDVAVAQVLIGAVGLVVLSVMWRRAVRDQPPDQSLQ